MDYYVDDSLTNKEKINLIIEMGFVSDENIISEALNAAMGNIDTAITLLVSEGSTESSDKKSNFPGEAVDTLKRRIFNESSHSMFKHDGELPNCLNAAIKLAKAGDAMKDNDCNKFLTSSMVEIYNKLLNSTVLMSWSAVSEVQLNIYHCCELMVELSMILLFDKNEAPIAEIIDCLAMIFDDEVLFFSNNKHISSKYSKSRSFTKNSIIKKSGYLMDLINKFGQLGGFDAIIDRLKREPLSLPHTGILLKPIAVASKYLNHDKPWFKTFHAFLTKMVLKIKDYDEAELKHKDSSHIFIILDNFSESIKLYNENQYSQIKNIHYDLLERMIKMSHFGARMSALQGLNRIVCELLNDTKNSDKSPEVETLQNWMTEKKIFSSILKGWSS